MLEASEIAEQEAEHDYALRDDGEGEGTNGNANQGRESIELQRAQMHFDHDYSTSPMSEGHNAGAGDDQQPEEADDNPSTSSAAAAAAVVQQATDDEPADDGAPALEHVDLTTTPTLPSKKRKRLSKSATLKSKMAMESVKVEDEMDDGLTCPICLDHWDMSGEHRLVSLKCGHLFGESCLRRWLCESNRQSGSKVCPQCKAKANPRDIRCLYAKRLCVIDRSEENRLRDLLEEQQQKTHTLQTELSTMRISYTLAAVKIQTLENENERMKQLLRCGGDLGGYKYGENVDTKELLRLPMCKLFMERNLEISRDRGCRVLTHADLHGTLIVSQKSTQSLFPGFGLRLIDTPTFRPSNFLHSSTKLVRDIALSANQHLVAVTSMETRCKLFDLRLPQSTGTVYSPGDKSLWSCTMDRADRETFLYLGAQNGSTYVYDVRHSDNVLAEFQMEGDISPVISVSTVPSNLLFSGGGFIVCKLQSIWFYEYAVSSVSTVATRLNLEGPFNGLNYDATRDTVVINVRNSSRSPVASYVFGKLDKIDGVVIFRTHATFQGSKVSPVMSRCTQIAVESNSLVAGYMQDVKLLSIFDTRRAARTQSLPVQDVVYDVCPVYTPHATYLAAVTDNKCRIYKVTSSTPQLQ